MLQLLKESVSSRHAERLEQIVIALIAIEIGMCVQLIPSLLQSNERTIGPQCLALLLFLLI